MKILLNDGESCTVTGNFIEDDANHYTIIRRKNWINCREFPAPESLAEALNEIKKKTDEYFEADTIDLELATSILRDIAIYSTINSKQEVNKE